METVTDFILGDSKITVDDDCSHLMQRANSLENTLMEGKVEGRKRRG